MKVSTYHSTASQQVLLSLFQHGLHPARLSYYGNYHALHSMAPQGLLMLMELFKVLVLVPSRWSNHWHRINSSLLTIVKLFCSRSKNPKCVKAFLEIRFCVLGWLLLRPRWVVMPSFKHDYNDRLVAVNRGINYLLHFTFTIDHVGWVGSSISKMCVGCILSDIQRNKF